jgi:hypothetical protein
VKEYDHVLIEKEYHDALRLAAESNFMTLKGYVEFILMDNKDFKKNLKKVRGE